MGRPFQPSTAAYRHQVESENYDGAARLQILQVWLQLSQNAALQFSPNQGKINSKKYGNISAAEWSKEPPDYGNEILIKMGLVQATNREEAP